MVSDADQGAPDGTVVRWSGPEPGNMPPGFPKAVQETAQLAFDMVAIMGEGILPALVDLIGTTPEGIKDRVNGADDQLLCTIHALLLADYNRILVQICRSGGDKMNKHAEVVLRQRMAEAEGNGHQPVKAVESRILGPTGKPHLKPVRDDEEEDAEPSS